MFDRVLNALERRLATDIRYAIRGISLLTVGQIASSGSSFVLALVFANLLSPETYGIYRYVLATSAILAIPALSGINNTLIQAVAAHKEGTVILAFRTKLRYGLIGSLGALIGSAYYLINDNVVLSACFAVVAVTIPAMEAFKLFDSVLQGRQDFKRSVIIDSVTQIIVVCSIVTTIFLTKSVIAIVCVYFLFWTAGRALAWFYVQKFLPKNLGAEDPRTIPFGRHLSIMGAGTVIAEYADQVLLFQHIGAAELALYSIAIAVPEQFKRPLKGVFSLLLPRYSTHSAQSIRATIWHKAGLLALVSLAMSVLYILLIPWALPFFFPKYAGAVFYSQLLSVSFVTVVSGIFTTALQALHKTRELYTLNIIQPVVQLIAVAIGVLFFGIIGAILARIVSKFVTLIVTMMLYQRSNTVA